ncbi:RING/U-box superfamily protein [Euphorbia peplus]|nr:RING/U-box superfamily protein [Euphorbia peplus]
MSCLIELHQFQKPKLYETFSQPVFSIDTSIHYEVHYSPNNLYMNLKSYREIIPLPLCDDVNNDLLCKIFTHILSRTLIPQSHFDSILVSVLTKLKYIACDSRYPPNNYIPLSMSIRVISTQEYNLEAQLAWQKMLDTPGEISSSSPATDKSVSELETVVYDREDKGLECPICLKEFEVGEEMTMMPCFHCYHGDCIAKWLKNSHQCPSCRFPMPVCSVVEGSFPFYKRNRCRKLFPQTIGGKVRKTARMSTRSQVY